MGWDAQAATTTPHYLRYSADSTADDPLLYRQSRDSALRASVWSSLPTPPPPQLGTELSMGSLYGTPVEDQLETTPPFHQVGLGHEAESDEDEALDTPLPATPEEPLSPRSAGGAPQHHTRRRKHCVGGCQSGTNTASVLSPGATGGWEDAVVKPPPRVPQTQGSSKIEVAAGWASPSPLAACAALVQATWCLRCASPPPSSSSAGVQRWCRQRLDQCTWPTQKAPLVCVP